ncbi:helix-turn-helix domain-containing protein [Myroides marinus]|uniref:helix-turn-helix domain-containing protein n=1 Tax=Myroides TaxID=76831 RepID=UPI000741A23F|nr:MULTISPECIES: helix-turn-helix domain-containing protein [Myroides]KUF45773.1 excisionase [Myroides marinus]MDM1348453.1 helix-turn-helix domain-containing protein [Myroides marinus]MDM1352191.1 helix-turn-helix domain-containing protein [Myroides marinus]MDM1354820.1 helix-turn-helix domain-containing protein [Myroides marinus]MDM1359370.1 helix-turn-helix domain-containing protein [Myroides marinus]
MNVTRTEFITWMERLSTRLDSLSENIDKLQLQTLNIDGEELLDNQDVLQILKISYRSLQRYRSNKKLPYYKLKGKIYYKLSDVQQLLRDCFSTPVRE